jgi:phosphate transport system protein
MGPIAHELGQHTSSRFDEDLERLRSNLLRMGGVVELQLNQGVAGLVQGDTRVADLVRAEEREVNALERRVDEDCSRLLAMRAPAASDLRFIVGALKMATDLERIGDEGEKIALLASRLAEMERPPNRYRELRHLGELVAAMVHDALDAFARQDAAAALEIARRDRIVDEEYESIQRQNITFMMEDPRAIRRALDVMWVVRSLERIGDHAKNVCEHLIYMVHGKDVRHTRLEDVERELKNV